MQVSEVSLWEGVAEQNSSQCECEDEGGRENRERGWGRGRGGVEKVEGKQGEGGQGEGEEGGSAFTFQGPLLPFVPPQPEG